MDPMAPGQVFHRFSTHQGPVNCSGLGIVIIADGRIPDLKWQDNQRTVVKSSAWMKTRWWQGGASTDCVGKD